VGRGAVARHALVAAALTAFLMVPLLVALVALREPPWVPLLDLAMTELRVRDVGTTHTPLIGLPGRVGGALGRPGSHLGPLSFYLLAPTYRLLGSTAWALQAACVVIQISAIAGALLIAGRRGGTMLMLGVATVLAVLTTGYGTVTLTEPWNPYLPVLPWLVFLLAVWAVACGDLVLLPVVVLAGTFCAQTHVPYLPLTAALGALAAAVAVTHWWRVRRDRDERGRARRWGLVALAVGILLWTPPTIDQILHEPGNYRVVFDYFTHPPTQTGGMSLALRLVLERVDLRHLLIEQFERPGTLISNWPGHVPSQARGVSFALLWLVSACAAVVLRHRALVGLHGVVGVALLLALVALSRLFGTVWYYLMLWVWGIAGLMAIAIGWTAAVVVARILTPAQQPRARAIACAALVLLMTAFVGRLAIFATRPAHGTQIGNGMLPVIDAVARALDEGVGDANGHDGRYLVMWMDMAHIGSQGYGLLNELERRGFDVGVLPTLHAYVNGRALDPNDADAKIVLANGGWVERWQAAPGSVEVASLDPRSPEQRREYEDLRATVKADFQSAGLTTLVSEVDRNLFAVGVDPRTPPATQDHLARMLELGVATAVFIVPPKAPNPPPP
jgi:hypothetical protein